MSVIVSGNEIVLNGCVGDPSGWGWDDCFTASDVILALGRVGSNNPVTIRINSGGGIATEGSAIHAALARHQGKKTIIVEGIAASAASVIAMAADDLRMALGSLMMIHLPSGMTIGDVDDHQVQINALNALADAMSTIYAAKSGRTAEQCLADMRAELWMTADEAVTLGYADAVAGTDDAEAGNVEPVPFDYTLYTKAPAGMVALTKSKRWANRSAPTAASPAGTGNPKTKPGKNHMTEDEMNAKLAAAKAEGVAEEAAAAAERERAAVANAQAGAIGRAVAADIAKLCADAAMPMMAASLIVEGVTSEQAKARVGAAGQIVALVALAVKDKAEALKLSDEMLAAGKTVAQVKEALFDRMAAASDTTNVSGVHTMRLPEAKPVANSATRAASKSNMEAQIKKLPKPKKEG